MPRVAQYARTFGLVLEHIWVGISMLTWIDRQSKIMAWTAKTSSLNFVWWELLTIL